MKLSFLLLLFISFSLFAVDRNYERGVQPDGSLKVNTLTVGSSTAPNSTDSVVIYGSVVNPPSTQSGTTFDFYKSGTVVCSSCGATSGAVTITLNGISDGGFYTLDMTDSSTATISFSSTGLSFFYNPVQAPRITGKISSFVFHRVGTKVLVTQIEF